MNNTLARGVVAAAITGAAFLGTAGVASADPVIVDKPDTSELNDKWTFAPLGIPLFGLIESIVQAPTRILPL
ncbi:hypothetical protein ACOBQX_11750 [Actinokineospora sp. G85]|uniref:hypothetical protein n=1 Tax=Actinokineospora sp. G85 TaxID=3406626 RepID=UPI003C79230B